MSSKCRLLALIVITVMSLSISMFEYEGAFSQSTDNVSNTDNGTGSSYETPINLTAVVKDSTDSMKKNLAELNKSIQNGNVSNALKQSNELNESIDALQQCMTLPFPHSPNQTSPN